MSTPAAPPDEFPSADTAPRAPYPPASMITPIPVRPHGRHRRAKGIAWSAVGGAVVSGVSWAVNEAGGLSAVWAWRIKLAMLSTGVLAGIAAAVAIAIFGYTLLLSAERDRKDAQEQAADQNRHMAKNLNELTQIAAKQQASVDLLAAMVREETHLNRTRDTELSKKVDRLTRKVDRLSGDTPNPDIEDEDSIPPRMPRQRDTDETAPASPTGRHRKVTGKVRT